MTLLAVLAFLPARAQDAESLPAPGQAVLSLLGAAPPFVGLKSAYQLGLSPPAGDFTTTTLFRGVPGGPDAASSKTWALSPGFVSNGRWATLVTSVSLQFGGSTPQPAGDVSLDRSFAVKFLYHGGVNLLGWTDAARKGRVALGIGPALSPLVGPKYTLQAPDGTLSYINLRIEVAPAVSLSLLGDRVSLVALAAYGPGSRLFVPLSFGVGKGTGSLEAFEASDDTATNIDDARDSLHTFYPSGTAFGMVMATVGFPAADRPFLTLGVRVDARRTEFSSSPGGQVWTSGFVEQELRAFVGLGISAPDGYDWSKP